MDNQEWYDIDFCRQSKYKLIEEMFRSKSREDKELAKNIISQEEYLQKDVYVDDQTLILLEFCTPYYEYIGVRTLVPEDRGWPDNFEKHSVFGQPWDKKAESEKCGCMKEVWSSKYTYYTSPAIWKAMRVAGLPGSVGNSHQYQINDKLSTGLYKNTKNGWLKKIIWEPIQKEKEISSQSL